MKWENDYPHICFRRKWEINQDLSYLLGKCEAYIETLSKTPIMPEDYKNFLELSLTKGAHATTAIEGNKLSHDSVVWIYRNGTSLKTKEYEEKEVANMLSEFNRLLRETMPKEEFGYITPDFIKSLNRRIGEGLGENFDGIPGNFRNDNRTVGSYRCPDYSYIESMMDLFCKWLREEFRYSSNQDFKSTLIEAIVSHVYLEWIHPFYDGNGRTGRLLEFYILLRGKNPDIASHILSNHYNETRSEYYSQISYASKTQDLTQFILYAVKGYEKGLKQTLKMVQRSLSKMAWHHYCNEIIKEKDLKTPVRKRLLNLLKIIGISRSESISNLRKSDKIIRIYQPLGRNTIYRDIEKLKGYGLLVEDKIVKPNLSLLRIFMPKNVRN